MEIIQPRLALAVPEPHQAFQVRPLLMLVAVEAALLTGLLDRAVLVAEGLAALLLTQEPLELQTQAVVEVV